MASLSLFIDTTANGLLAGLNAPASVNPASLPFYFGDTLSLKVFLLNSTGTTLSGTNPFTIIPTVGITFFLYLDDGTVGGTIYTQQISWASDPNFSYFFATLSLNTAALQTLLGAATNKTCWLKAGYVQNGLQTTVLSVQVNIGVGLPNTNLTVPANLTPLSVEVATAMFVRIDGNPNNPGNGFFLISPSGKQIYVCAIDNPDGSTSLDASPAG